MSLKPSNEDCSYTLRLLDVEKFIKSLGHTLKYSSLCPNDWEQYCTVCHTRITTELCLYRDKVFINVLSHFGGELDKHPRTCEQVLNDEIVREIIE